MPLYPGRSSSRNVLDAFDHGRLRSIMNENLFGNRMALVFVGMVLISLALMWNGTAVAKRAIILTPRPVYWHVVSLEGSHALKISSNVEQCYGQPRPKFSKVIVKEWKDRAYIKTSAVFKRLVSADACLFSGLSLFRTVRIRQDLSDVKVYDTKSQPPRLRHQ